MGHDLNSHYRLMPDVYHWETVKTTVQTFAPPYAYTISYMGIRGYRVW